MRFNGWSAAPEAKFFFTAVSVTVRNVLRLCKRDLRYTGPAGAHLSD
jgi:hypothetical protein